MNNSFIYDGNEVKSFRKYCNLLFSTYVNIVPDLIKVSNMMYDIEKEYIINEKEKDIEMTLQQSVNLSRKIINYYYGKEYLDQLNDIIYKDKIKFYNANDDNSRIKYDEYNGSAYDICGDCIFIPLENNLIDVFNIVHEFMHYSNKDYSRIVEYEFLSEVSSILSGLFVVDYLNSHSKDKESIYNNLNEEILMDYCFNKEIKTNKECINTYDTCEMFFYTIARLLASKIYKDYSNNPEQTLEKIVRFNENFGNKHFNASMKDLNINVRYKNGKLNYKEEYLNELLSCYNDYVEMVQKRNIKVFKR